PHVRLGILTQASDIQHAVLDSMAALSLLGAAGVEEPVLGLAQFIVVDHLLAGLHDAVLTEVEVGGLIFVYGYFLQAGLHLTAVIERILFGINGEDFQALGSVIRSALLEIELESFAVLVDALDAFDGPPALDPLSGLIVILIGSD